MQTGLAEQTTEDENFRYDLLHTLGYLNASNHMALGPTLVSPQNAAGATGEPGGLAHLTFPNRPYIGHYDLMLVPASAPGRLFHEFTTPRLGPPTYFFPSGTNSFYDVTTDFKIPFGHCLNFYHTDNTVGTATVKVPHLYRLFDFVEVPSRFVGTRHWYAPTNAIPELVPPFNSMSAYRDPGVINVNTIVGPEVWRSFMGDNNAAPAPADYFASWTDMDSNATTGRRGTPDGLGRFGASFRGPWMNTLASDTRRGILRPGRDSNPLPGTNRIPLLARQTGPLTSAVDFAPRAFKDPTRHGHAYLSGITRLSNLVDKQSNVYAIWITVGYFEVNDAGVLNGRELGTDDGTSKRHRAFYMVDRSIPVAYQRGQNHNVEKAVLLRRYIE